MKHALIVSVLTVLMIMPGVVEQDPALRQAARQAFYNTSKFTMRDLKARSSSCGRRFTVRLTTLVRLLLKLEDTR